VRDFLPAWLLGVGACLSPAAAIASESVLEIELLEPSARQISASVVTSGSLDDDFELIDDVALGDLTGPQPFWIRLRAPEAAMPAGAPVVTLRKARHVRVELFTDRGGDPRSVPLATDVPGFLATHDAVFILPDDLEAGQALYARVDPSGRAAGPLRFATSTLEEALARAAEHARMIALTFGALIAMAVAAFLIWFILADKLLILYAALFSLHAVYVAFLSGQAFEWPVLSYALPLAAYTWNVPAALSGAVASLFVREIAQLQRFSPRVYRAFGWLAVTFVVLAFANLAQHVGLGHVVAAIGNLIFVGAAVFTLVVAWLAWRRNNRAAGWFLIAWGLLETLTIATAIRLLVADIEDSAALLYYGLPLSMVAAAVLIALGVADRLRDQRLALTDAERRAQTDSLTGVLNRRSLLEQLDAACLRAKARGLPVALLFIDLDHFKEINDSFGHAAGDACLRAIVDPMQAELRQSDVIGRYGGEEFIVILSSADLSAARPVAERIRKRIADIRIAGFSRPIHVTCSIGVATSDMLGVWGEHLIARADEAVYAAKRSGRNQVQIAAPMAA
jgi:diguanylate cyclase (GGDEF)-like protein